MPEEYDPAEEIGFEGDEDAWDSVGGGPAAI
jgi:hypothetical protein